MFSEFVSDIFNETCNRFNGSASAYLVDIISSSYHNWSVITVYIPRGWGLLDCPPPSYVTCVPFFLPQNARISINRSLG